MDLGEIREVFLTGRIPLEPCPRCGHALRMSGGSHWIGRREHGSKTSGGTDYAFCDTCGRSFEQVFDSRQVGPVTWQERANAPPGTPIPPT